MFQSTSKKKYIWIIALILHFSIGNLVAFPVLDEISQSTLDSSLVHSAVLHAHNTGDSSILSMVLDKMPETIEFRTEKREIIHYSSNDKRYHTAWELGITPLELAIRLDNLQLVQFLVEKGAAVNSVRNQYYAHHYQGEKIASPNQFFSYTLLYAAILNGNTGIVELMLSSGANPQEVINLRIKDWEYQVFLDKIYSAEKFTIEKDLSDMHLIFANLDLLNHNKGILSLIEKNPNVKVDSTEYFEDRFGCKISISNGWILSVNSEDINLFTKDCYLQLSQQADRFLEIKKFWFEGTDRYKVHCSKVLGHALCLDNSTADYLFVPAK